MATMALKVITTEYDFVDKCVMTINDNSNTMEIEVYDTEITELQNAYNELIVSPTINEMGIFTSGNLSSANWKYSSVSLQSDSTFLRTIESASGTNYRLSLAVTL